MPTSTLREPWFLRGRTSVVLRATLMSLALGGLGCLTGIAWLISSIIIMKAVHDRTQFALTAGAGAFLFAVGVGIPYGRWRGASARTITLRVTGMALGSTLMPLFVLSSLTPQAQAAVERWAPQEMRIAFDALLVLIVIWLAWCISLLQISWRWLLMLGLSALAFPAIPFLTEWMEAAQAAFRNAVRGIPEVATAFEAASSVGCFGQFFVLFFAPWGIPFWFPPAREPAP